MVFIKQREQSKKSLQTGLANQSEGFNLIQNNFSISSYCNHPTYLAVGKPAWW
jgi:hypothetical protein